jgi:hypothetical protein
VLLVLVLLVLVLVLVLLVLLVLLLVLLQAAHQAPGAGCCDLGGRRACGGYLLQRHTTCSTSPSNTSLKAALPARLQSTGTAPAAAASLARLVLPLTRVWKSAAALMHVVAAALAQAGHQRRHSACVCCCAAALGQPLDD